MGNVVWRSIALLVVVGVSSMAWQIKGVRADPSYPAYDISWPQCPDKTPTSSFLFAIIGLNNGRPFTSNPCFREQYAWATLAEPHPDVYINLEFPRADASYAGDGPYGRCAENDGWCRGYNYGWWAAADAVQKATTLGVRPSRYWLDVEMDNYWSDAPRDNAQVVRGALDRFRAMNLSVGIYGTRYQWNLITGGFQAPGVPLWVAGAEFGSDAISRCTARSFTFAGGVTWMVQYPYEGYDGNYRCPNAGPLNAAASPAAPEPAPAAQPTVPPPSPSPQPVDSVRPKPVAAASPVPVFSVAEVKRIFAN